MVESSVEHICSVVFKTLLINNLKVEFIKEFLSLYLSLIEFFEGDEIYKIFIIYISVTITVFAARV